MQIFVSNFSLLISHKWRSKCSFDKKTILITIKQSIIGPIFGPDKH